MSTRSKSTKARIESEAKAFDWSNFDALSDSHIEAAAESDPDVVLLADGDLAEADIVIPYKARKRTTQTAE